MRRYCDGVEGQRGWRRWRRRRPSEERHWDWDRMSREGKKRRWVMGREQQRQMKRKKRVPHQRSSVVDDSLYCPATRHWTLCRTWWESKKEEKRKVNE